MLANSPPHGVPGMSVRGPPSHPRHVRPQNRPAYAPAKRLQRLPISRVTMVATPFNHPHSDLPEVGGIGCIRGGGGGWWHRASFPTVTHVTQAPTRHTVTMPPPNSMSSSLQLAAVFVSHTGIMRQCWYNMHGTRWWQGEGVGSGGNGRPWWARWGQPSRNRGWVTGNGRA